MSAETAKLIFFAVASVMWLVWVAGTLYALSRLRARRTVDPAGGFDPEPPEADLVAGRVAVEGDRESLSRKIAEQLASGGGLGGMSFVRVTERTSERVAFERLPGFGGRGLPFFDSGLVTLERRGGRVEVRYAVRLKRFASIMGAVTYLVCFVYGGIFVVAAPLLIWHLVVTSENPGVRMQVFQTLQMVHGVWPPFLVGFLSGRMRKATRAYFETLLANLEHIA